MTLLSCRVAKRGEIRFSVSITKVSKLVNHFVERRAHYDGSPFHLRGAEDCTQS